MAQEKVPKNERSLPQHLGARIWAALTDAFLPFNAGITGQNKPAMQMNEASAAYAQEAKNDLYSSGGATALLSPAAASPVLELIEMEMRIRLEWLSH